MKTIRVDAAGGPEALKPVMVPDPVPGAGEVVIQVRAIGVNFVDALHRRGDLPPAGGYPFYPGCEVSGQIIERGPDCGDLGTNEMVMALPSSGGYADLVVCPANRVYPAPDGFSFEQAAAFPINFLTAYFALNAYAPVVTDMNVLIHAAGGGVGTAAVQIANAMGARVMGTAGEDRKLAWLRELGVVDPINYQTHDFRDEVRRITNGLGADLVLDSVGGETFTRSVDIMAPFGHIVSLGAVSGAAPINVGPFIQNNLNLHGLNLNGYFPDRVRAALSTLSEIRRETGMAPVINSVLPFSDAAEAHRFIESRQTFGKIVLTV